MIKEKIYITLEDIENKETEIYQGGVFWDWNGEISGYEYCGNHEIGKLCDMCKSYEGKFPYFIEVIED